MSAIFAFILGHALDWLKKLVIIVLLDQLFGLLSLWLHLNDLKYLWWYLGSILLYHLTPEDAFIYINFGIDLCIGLAVFLWVFGSHHLPGHHKTHD